VRRFVQLSRGSPIERQPMKLRDAVAEARFYQGDHAFERALALAPLTFSVRTLASANRLHPSYPRYGRYLARVGTSSVAARDIYVDVVRLRVERWVLPPLARIGQLFQLVGDTLSTAAVPQPQLPRRLRTEAQRREYLQQFTYAFCDRMEDQGRFLSETKARGRYDICVERAEMFTVAASSNRWARVCERELVQIRPDRYSFSSEIAPVPHYHPPLIRRAGIIEIPGGD
jgi:hypothetical protein